MNAIERLIAEASKWVGYLEKKSNAQLDEFTANAGSKNYTRFNRDLISYKQGIGAQPMEWCAAFVSCVFVYAFGLELAKKLLCGGLHCYTPSGANYFKKKGRYTKRGAGKPQKGDVVFFYSTTKKRIGHVGIVYKVSSSKVYTIEGNTSGANTLVTNGGGVKKKYYSLTSTYIDGYGRPDYSIVDAELNPVDPYDTLKKGDAGNRVGDMQKLLLRWNPACLPKYGADSDFGSETEKALTVFQTEKGMTANGECDKATWEELEKLISKTVKVTGGSVNVRAGAGTSFKKLGIARKGETYTYVSTDKNGWYGIEYKNAVGWISPKYSTLNVNEA